MLQSVQAWTPHPGELPSPGSLRSAMLNNAESAKTEGACEMLALSPRRCPLSDFMSCATLGDPALEALGLFEHRTC